MSRGKDSDAAAFGALMAAETWLTAQEAIDLGLADDIGATAPKARAAWDLSAYAKPPVQDAIEAPKINDAPEAPAAINEIEHRQRIHALRLRTPA